MCELILTQRERDEIDWEREMGSPMPGGIGDQLAHEMANTARALQAVGKSLELTDAALRRALA